ncbi:DUF3017 domain-containing protein [Saccharopolyspora shandongensis]|uniref:DUF3017 domain-containing protein n=1 Tax=Saccharopolyspora shandongensis TaxID=418495 RepID=A0A1H3PWI5_9PSEU|nr:DUF3017 domain-containing protein [Saccharopolyspora shandongensis]SDZ05426.1 Protein of unknown function [Saccharopolyspora shandongensis]
MSERFGGRSRLSVHVPFGLVLLIGLIGLLLVSLGHWRKGSVLLGGALLLAAAMRAMVPPERTGLLTIRSRAVDVLVYSGFGLVIIAVAMTIKGGGGLLG